jgi:hypothetical protein
MRSISVYFIGVIMSLNACVYNDLEVDCGKSDLRVILEGKKDPTLCSATDGTITVSASGGDTPYSFAISGKVGFFPSGSFTQLGAGLYDVVVRSGRGCQDTLKVVLASTSTLSASSVVLSNDTQCFGDNGSIKATASLGKPPYQFQFQQSSFKKSSTGDTTINGLKFGDYIFTVKDAEGCLTAINVKVNSNTGISYKNTIKTIIDTRCNTTGCHNGDIGASRDWRSYNLVKTNALNIKGRTGSKEMPPQSATPLTAEQISQIACWVDDGALDN